MFALLLLPACLASCLAAGASDCCEELSAGAGEPPRSLQRHQLSVEPSAQFLQKLLISEALVVMDRFISSKLTLHILQFLQNPGLQKTFPYLGIFQPNNCLFVYT